ncbi:uncharacterized protein Afti isoform X2 [Eurosta solidaginis]|uniref:uncharacterized protein Afti isoform X2 n=1 Tax=Eurosta solidaginis TaxID=178769 RepID=UPI0035316CFC
MAGAPTIPPLLCNTPPPIDFDEEDDDSGLPPTLALEDDDGFGEFALVTDMNEDETNGDVSSLPHTPLQFELSSTTTSGFTDVPPIFEDCGTVPITPPPLLKSSFESKSEYEEEKDKTQLNETYNNNSTKAVNADRDHAEATDSGGEEVKNIQETTNAQTQKVQVDNKQTTIYSSDTKITNSSRITQPQMSTTVGEETDDNVCNSATDNVLLEDVADDSSDEDCNHSSSKSLSSPTSKFAHIDGFGSDDFFAIHVADALSSSSSTIKTDKRTSILENINMNKFANHNNNIIDDIKNKTVANLNRDEEPVDFADFASASEYTKSASNVDTAVDPSNTVVDLVVNSENAEKGDETVDIGAFASDDDDDFDDFHDFCTAPTTESTAVPNISTAYALIQSTNNNINTAKNTEVAESLTSPEVNSLKNDDDDYDFGDFEGATFDTPTWEVANTSSKSDTYKPTVGSGNICESVGTVLKQMFPSTNDQVSGNDSKSEKETKLVKTLPGLQSKDTKLRFESIETAKALEFQWPQSEMRHALIRSIGIDSRNILFGENWNPSMPRFAANLSFNPLKPMKPETSNTPNSISTSSGGSGAAYAGVTADSMHFSTTTYAANTDNSSYAIKTDVPEVDFDWRGGDLVNPLDGIKGKTNARETETIHPAPPVARFDTSDDQPQSHTSFTNIGDVISENLNNTNIEVTASPLRDVSHMSLSLDMTTQHFGTTDSNITSDNNNFNSKTYDNSKILTTLHLGANIINNEQVSIAEDEDDDDETVVTSTYAGPLKETHIYTPSKTELALAKSNKSTAINSEPIDFDYEIAAAGIIIDEKVVKKEYRDVEYNPGFSLEVVNEYAEELAVGTPTILTNNDQSIRTVLQTQTQTQAQISAAEFDNDDFTEFTEFQSVPPTQQVTSLPTPAVDGPYAAATSPPGTIKSGFPEQSTAIIKVNNSGIQPIRPVAVAKTKETNNTPSRTNSPSIIDNMILSPAILLPQAIPIGTNNTTAKKSTTPAIEWGDSTANIDPDELARIEELFPQPKMTATNLTQKQSPTHTNAEKKAMQIATTTISASVAMKEQDSTLNDDYWSEFVSVPVKPQISNRDNRLNNNSDNPSRNNNNNNNQLVITTNSALRSTRQQQQQLKVQRTLTPTPQQKSNAATNAVTPSTKVSANTTSLYNNSNTNSNSNSNDDDWSDFVSSTPAATASSNSFTPATHAPQFNSAAWQNANFYNNPLGIYHQHARNAQLLTPLQQQLQLQQQIHIMQDFSTAPTTTTARPHINLHKSSTGHINNMQHSSYSPMQVGNARVAPSISLIPDLGFVAPALPVHTAFVNVLPKTSFNTNKK